MTERSSRRARACLAAVGLAAAVAMVCCAGLAQAADYRLTQMIVIPGAPLAAYDASFADPSGERYYLADRSNARVDIVDAGQKVWIGSVGGFIGFTGATITSGPNGLAGDGDRLYASDGDSTVKVIDLRSRTVIQTVSTGGTKRVDLMAADPDGQRLLVVNNADEPPFLTLISTGRGRRRGAVVLFGHVTVPGATGGLEAPVWDPDAQRFYVSVPQLNGDDAHSGVAVFDPRTGAVERVYDVGPCGPNGLALGPHQELLLGCGQPHSVILDARTGAIVATITEVGGSDQVWFNPGDHRYYLAARNNPGGPVLGVIDAGTHRWIQNVPTSPNSLSVAANPLTNDVFVPLTADPTSPCPAGCIGVFRDVSGADALD